LTLKETDMFKHICLSGALLALAIGGYATISLAEQKPAAGGATPSTQPIDKMCAVERDDKVDPTVPTVTYNGKVIGFCCSDCPPKFKANPEKYMKDLK